MNQSLIECESITDIYLCIAHTSFPLNLNRKKLQVIPKTKKKFGHHVRRNVRKQPVPPTAPVDDPGAPEDDVAQPIVETHVRSSLEPPNPYKKIRVGECHHILVDRDDEIAQLKQAMEASKQESLAKDAIIAERKESMQ